MLGRVLIVMMAASLGGCTLLSWETKAPKLAGVLMAGRDVKTDGWIVGIGGDCTNVMGGVGLEGTVELGKGAESYEVGAFGKTQQQEGEIDYSILRASSRLRYRVPITSDGQFVAYPMVAPGYYRWKQKDCDFEGCTENLFVADIGGGIMYRFVGLEVFTTANGPDFGVRLRASVPIIR